MNACNREGSAAMSILDTTRSASAFRTRANQEETKMKTITKIAAGALVACGLAVAAAAPANAADVRFGIGFAAPAPRATCYDYYGRPYYCGYRNYYAPGYFGVTFGGHRDWHDHDWRGGYWRDRDGHDRDFHGDRDGWRR